VSYANGFASASFSLAQHPAWHRCSSAGARLNYTDIVKLTEKDHNDNLPSNWR
jgi:hypothetical protein